MSQRPQQNPQLPDHINNSNEHPLKDFLVLALAAVVIISALTWLVAASASWLGPHIPYQWELRWQSNSGQQTTAEGTDLTADDTGFTADSTSLTSDDVRTTQTEQALQQLLNKLVGDDALPVQLHYLSEEPDANAFATLGGHIFITRGLLSSVQSENGLAMVLAHEYAHIYYRHPMILALEQASLALVFSLLGSDNIAQSVSQNTSMLTILSFSRDMERAADRFALERLQAVYGHSQGADEFFLNLQRQHDAETLYLSEFLQTHPLTEERIQRIRQHTARHDATAATLTPLPARLKIGQ